MVWGRCEVWLTFSSNLDYHLAAFVKPCQRVAPLPPLPRFPILRRFSVDVNGMMLGRTEIPLAKFAFLAVLSYVYTRCHSSRNQLPI